MNKGTWDKLIEKAKKVKPAFHISENVTQSMLRRISASQVTGTADEGGLRTGIQFQGCLRVGSIFHHPELSTVII